MTPAGWNPDPAGVPGRLRWWDGQTWTAHVHDPGPGPTSAPGGSALAAPVVVVGPPGLATPGCRVFELTDAAGGRLGRLVETSRGTNDSALGAALSRSKGWQHATTRELRGAHGFPELVLSWGPAATGVIVITLPDRRSVGRLVLGSSGWDLLDYDGRVWATATRSGATGIDAGRLFEVTHDGTGGWRAVHVKLAAEPLRSLAVGAAMAADLF